MKNWSHQFAELLTVNQAVRRKVTQFSRKELEKMARDNSSCEVCDRPSWRFAGLGMCFTCITGESDASDDSELKLIK